MNGFGVVLQNIMNTTTLLTSEAEPFVIMFTEQTIYQVLGHMFTVLLLFFILAKLLFKPVRAILDKRREEIASEYQRIEEDTQAVATLKTEYEDKLKNINKEADHILAHARKRAIEREDEIVKEAKVESDRILKRAHVEIEREKELMKDEMRKEIIEVATVMASKFVAASINEDQKNQLVNETLADMGASTWLN